jgi:hypothetical protein
VWATHFVWRRGRKLCRNGQPRRRTGGGERRPRCTSSAGETPGARLHELRRGAVERGDCSVTRGVGHDGSRADAHARRRGTLWQAMGRGAAVMEKAALSRTAAGGRVRWAQRRDLGEESPDKWDHAKRTVAGGWGHVGVVAGLA